MPRNAVGIAFASIDVIRVDGAWRVLEINSGVMMEALAKLHPELVQADVRCGAGSGVWRTLNPQVRCHFPLPLCGAEGGASAG